MGLKIMYHQFMQGFYTPKLLKVLEQSPTNAEMIRNAGELERVCQRLLPHTQALVNLTPSGSETHQKYTEKLSSLREMIDKSQRYQQIGSVAKRLFGS